MTDDKRLIEDYLPIEKISAEASREKTLRKGNISTLHLWWARRPLVACRAAVYGAFVPMSQFVPNGATDEKKRSLGRANAAKFIDRLCQFPATQTVIVEAQQHILAAHAARLTQEMGKLVTVEDIIEGRSPRPKVLDMFAGGGAIPLEALRLGCEAFAVDLNPVAHIIELSTLVYPQKYGKPDPSARGMIGAKNGRGETTWGGLAEEVRYWGNWVLNKIKAEFNILYPLIPDPAFKGKKFAVQSTWLKENIDTVPPGYLTPVAYLWTRTVVCKNPRCGATVPLVRQTWLRKKKGRNVALRMVASKGNKEVRFEIVEADAEDKFNFDPADFSRGGNAACPFCSTVADKGYVSTEGRSGRMGVYPMAVVATGKSRGKHYFNWSELNQTAIQESTEARKRLENTANYLVPAATIDPWSGVINPPLHGLTQFTFLYNERQLAMLLAIIKELRSLHGTLLAKGHDPDRALGLVLELSAFVDQLADWNSSLCMWNPKGEKIRDALPGPGVGMVWDFIETNPLAGGSGSLTKKLDRICDALSDIGQISLPATVVRGNAFECPEAGDFDAVITDPPYYGNIPYSHLSDFTYVWLRCVLGDHFREHFAGEKTPKKTEAIASVVRDKDNAKEVYEDFMTKSLVRAKEKLKKDGVLVCVYAHKTTSGWATLIDSLRKAGFQINEAWPVAMEMEGRVIAQDAAALKSNIFIVARKRTGLEAGKFESVRPELEQIVRERVSTLWDMGISGADLVIACVGAGLRAFTRFIKVEYANGEEVPAERFLTSVEEVVLDTILARLSKEVGGNGSKYSLAGLDSATRFYVLWRYTYKATDIDAGEAIIFANGTHVELDGLRGLSAGTRALVDKKGGKYRLLDYTTRGDDAALGLPHEDGQTVPLIDALHRLLWLMERHPSGVPDFLRDARPNTEQMRLVAQALAGPALKGGELGNVATGTELASLTKLTANWRSVVEDADLTRVELEARRSGQSRIQFDKGGLR